MAYGTVRRRRLGNRLKAARQAAGMTANQAASHLRTSAATVSRMERGHVGVRTRDLEALLDLYGVDGAERAELLELGAARNERGWWTRHASVLSPGYASFIGFESEADEIWTWDPVRAPGHWQTDAYYRAMVESSSGIVVSPEQVDALADVRRERQRHLAASRPAQHAILDESVLHRIVGDQKVMAEQFQRLIDAALEPETTIQILPYEHGAVSAGFGCGISVLSYADGLRVVWTESPANETSIEDERPDVCIVIYDHLRSAALSSADSLEMLRAALERSV